MGALVEYRLEDGIATIMMDDGKVNVMSLPMQGALHEALDRAERDHAVVLLVGRPGVFSAGFDLQVLGAGGADAAAMAQGGFELAARVLAFPAPVVVACTGHAIAMGAFLLLSGDYRVGAAGPYKLMANEVGLGITIPLAAIEILRNRLTPSALNRATLLAEPFSPGNAVEAGFLDRVVAADEVLPVAREMAHTLTQLDLTAHSATKLRARASTLDALARAIGAVGADLASRS